jgi:predicted membrane-bound spermidine synthase
MRLLPAVLIATATGGIAISYEIVWLRTFSFAMQSWADSFGLLLGAYLAGLAIGAYVAGIYCRRRAADKAMAETGIMTLLGGVLLTANAAAFMVVPAMAACAGLCRDVRNTDLAMVAVATALLGMILPLIAHAALAPDRRAGLGFSYIYAGNIVGSVMGGLVTGFWLFDVATLPPIAFLLALCGLVVSTLVLMAGRSSRIGLILPAAGMIAAGLLLAHETPKLYADIYGQLHYGGEYRRWGPLPTVIETNSGIVAISRSGNIYSGGAYEGRFNVNPLPGKDHNRVARAYLTAAFHPGPRDILLVGLGSGSWAQVLAHHPDVKTITVVEINPGFVRMVPRQPIVASLLDNPKVTIIIDDGRRYLRRTERLFDVIVQNTIVYWRAHATNLLSAEYFTLTRARLRPDGRLYVNTTRSAVTQKTLLSVFPDAMRYETWSSPATSQLSSTRPASVKNCASGGSMERRWWGRHGTISTCSIC